MDISQFLNPAHENIEDSLDEIDAQILAKYGPEAKAETDEVKIKHKITHSEVLDAIYKCAYMRNNKIMVLSIF